MSYNVIYERFKEITYKQRFSEWTKKTNKASGS